MKSSHRPAWQLPPGVGRGTWDYVTTPEIASEYDAYHREHPLLRLDQAWIAERLREIPASPSPVLLDLGCGTGRALVPWLERGWRTIGVDLSQSMLEEATRKCEPWRDASALVQANIAELDGFRDAIADAAICLYSSIGMVRGASHRLAMLRSVHRILKPKGILMIHVHNRGNWWLDRTGMAIAARSWWEARRDPQSEYGDRVYPYRNLPTMFLHIFSRSEIRGLLQRAGFAIESLRPLNRTSSDWLRAGRFCPSLRAGGFLVTAMKVEKSGT